MLRISYSVIFRSVFDKVVLVGKNVASPLPSPTTLIGFHYPCGQIFYHNRTVKPAIQA